MTEMVTRNEARALGLKRFFDGEPCKHGHVCEKYTLQGQCVECNNAAFRRYRHDNIEEEKKRRKQYYENTKEVQRIKNKAWWAAHPEALRANKNKRRARQQGAEGSHTAEEISRLYNLQNGKCAICFNRLKKDYHEDHIIPLCKGGTNYISNIQLTCPACNWKKRAKDPIVFAQEIGRLL